MNKQELLARRDYFNLVHAVTVRAVDAFSDSELDFRPKLGMRTPRDLNTGTIAGSFMRISGCSGKSRQCCTTIRRTES
jgi:hypothetical protein